MGRYTEVPFPPYSYVPGQQPHPTSDPRGHHFGKPEPQVTAFDADSWPRCLPYLYGIDLFNAEYFWEAHEQWEAVWHAVGRRGATAAFVKGLIKLAAAGVKENEGKPNGVGRHAQRAAELFQEVLDNAPDARIRYGLPVPWLQAACQEIGSAGKFRPLLLTLELPSAR